MSDAGFFFLLGSNNEFTLESLIVSKSEIYMYKTIVQREKFKI